MQRSRIVNLRAISLKCILNWLSQEFPVIAIFCQTFKTWTVLAAKISQAWRFLCCKDEDIMYFSMNSSDHLLVLRSLPSIWFRTRMFKILNGKVTNHPLT